MFTVPWTGCLFVSGAADRSQSIVISAPLVEFDVVHRDSTEQSAFGNGIHILVG